jgi:hypothetical protein
VRGNERTLLRNLLESLDRLYDRQRGPADADALLTATASAVKDQSWIGSIEQASTALRDLIRSMLPPEEEYRVLPSPANGQAPACPLWPDGPASQGPAAPEVAKASPTRQ